MKNIFAGRKSRWLAAIFAVLIIIAMIPTPYYLYQPGSAEELAPRVTVENGRKNEQGSFYLTTVLSIKASNIYYLAYGLLAKDTEIRKAQEVRGDMSDEEYGRLLEHMMSASQQNAAAAAFKAAREPVKVLKRGVFVYDVMPQSHAKDILQVGDVIVAADGKRMGESKQFIDYLAKNKQAGDTVELEYKQGGKHKRAAVKLINVGEDRERAGIGIIPEDEVGLELPRKVDFLASDIGGPSAGLMFSLEIYNQLTGKDLTKGYEIAGTGTIDVEGRVGQIGGIRDKIVAAHHAGIDIFFCPKDVAAGDANERDAVDEAKKRGYSLDIVPVETMKEAVAYLSALDRKP